MALLPIASDGLLRPDAHAGVPTKHIQRISEHRMLAALSGYLEVADEQVEGAIAKLVFFELGS